MKKVLFIFAELTDQDVDWMIASGTKQEVPEGKVLIEEGKAASSIFVVLHGLFNVTISALGGTEVARMGAGEMLGEVSFVDSLAASGTVKALTNSVVLALPRSLVFARLRQDSAFAARFYRALAVLLAYRVRMSSVRKAGGADEEAEARFQLDAGILDNIHLAGARFERLTKKLMGG
jgi:CRP-like cAMP-binding protein